MQTTGNIIVAANAPVVQVKPALDIFHERLQDGRITLGLREVIEHLAAQREEEPESWPEYARACLQEPVCQLLYQDPFTYRAFAKPRGYAGDAVMMDYIYGLGEAKEAVSGATPLGRKIFKYLISRPSPRAVRHRRQLIATLIDRVAGSGGARVLAVAAGHLREAECSNAVQTGKVQDYVAFDQDEGSLAVVARDYARLGVRTMAGSVRQILCGNPIPGEFDLVYAAGLFDYLDRKAATALTCHMFDMTSPGGLMLIPNFLTGVRDSGYMEAFMDWRLIYRDHSDMEALAAALPRNAVAGRQIFDDPDHAITYLLVAKAG
jgi:hypothetical protein